MLGLRPFFSYFGGKWRAAPKYPPPKYDTIVEPFAGAAGYSLRYYERQVILVDKDPNIVKIWKYLIRVDSEEIRSLPILKEGEDLIDFNLTDEQRAFLGFRIQQGSATINNICSKFGAARWTETRREQLAEHVTKIRHWVIFHGSYQDIEDNPEVTWFVDPPYQVQGKYYRFSLVDYSNLSDWCRMRNGQIIVCENQGADWLPFEYFYEMKSANGKNRSKYSHEVVWVQG